MPINTLCGSDYLRMVCAGASSLGSGRKEINDLNVFPIPDGDTGDNMYMTIRSGCDAGAALDGTDTIGNVASAVSSGMLLGARGNSGVILSRIFAGLASGLKGLSVASVQQWEQALICAVREAYASVAVPVEGTMLTVCKDAVNAALSADDFDSCLDALCTEASSSLKRTPDLLSVLREAGVVDSGGAGLSLIFEGMKKALDGQWTGDDEPQLAGSPAKVDISAFTEDSVLEFGYCTEFLLRLQTSKVGDVAGFDESVIREYLEGAGDSLVFFRDGSIIKTHVHTCTPGDVLNHCQRWGEFLTIKIENMTLQHHENHMEEKKFGGVRKKYSVVTVASGDGVVQLFKDAGVDCVIEGGQTMNPSAESFIKAFESLNSDVIYVLPNNSNIVLTASQAAELYKNSDVRVIPTKSIGAGYTVVGSVDFSGDPDLLVAEAAEIAGNVATGMVSVAIRDTKDVREGDYIGFRNGQILCSDSSRIEAALKLCDSLGSSGADILIVLKGAGVPDEEADELSSTLQSKYPRCEVAFVDGGQPVFDYIIILQ